MMQLVIYAAHGYRFGGYEYSIFMDYITVTVMTPFQQHVEHPLTHACVAQVSTALWRQGEVLILQPVDLSMFAKSGGKN
jgi:hypothetical protein